MTDAEQKVLDAAREWLEERTPHDVGEKRLFVALARAFPADVAGKEACKCGEADSCDECLTGAQVEALLVKMESELARANG